MSHLPYPPGWQCHFHSSVGQPCPFSIPTSNNTFPISIETSSELLLNMFIFLVCTSKFFQSLSITQFPNHFHTFRYLLQQSSFPKNNFMKPFDIDIWEFIVIKIVLENFLPFVCAKNLVNIARIKLIQA